MIAFTMLVLSIQYLKLSYSKMKLFKIKSKEANPEKLEQQNVLQFCMKNDKIVDSLSVN